MINKMFGNVVKLYILPGFICMIFLISKATVLNSQIIYTDIADTILTFPEETPGALDDSTNYFYFDLNADGEFDFYFSTHYWEEWMSPSSPEYPNYVMTLGAINNEGVPCIDPCAIDFAHDDTIQSDIWLELGHLYVDVFLAELNCNLPFNDRYFGLKLTEGGSEYFGWIRLDADTDTLIFKDFACMDIPDEVILAGQTETLGQGEYISKENNIYFDGDNIIIKQENFNYKSYSVYTINGREILKGNINSQKIAFDRLNAGIYIIKLDCTENHVVKKIIKH